VYGFRCNVTYSVGAQPYQAQADIGYQNGNRAALQPWTSRIHAGDRISIAYNPADPTHVRFAGDSTIAYAAPLMTLRFAAWLIGAAALMIFISRRLRPESETASDVGRTENQLLS
jgi:hypothetical protein